MRSCLTLMIWKRTTHKIRKVFHSEYRIGDPAGQIRLARLKMQNPTSVQTPQKLILTRLPGRIFSGQKAESRILGLLAVLILSFLIPTNSFGSSCGDTCLSKSDCPSSCPICVHAVCVDCGAMANSTDCSDVGSGASTSCEWRLGACVEFPEIPFHSVSVPLLTLLSFFSVIHLRKKALI